MLSDITIYELGHYSHQPPSIVTYENVSYHFGMGLIASDIPSYYKIESKHELPSSLPSNYIVASFDNDSDKHLILFFTMFPKPNAVPNYYMTTVLDKIGNPSLQQLCDKYRKFIESFGVNTYPYTCVIINCNTTTIYKFNHLDFLVGLVNGFKQLKLVELIGSKVFHNYRLCDITYDIKQANIWNIVDEINTVLKYSLLPDLIKIIEGYCTSITPIIVIDNIQIATEKDHVPVLY